MPQYSREWWEVRRGVPTASEFHRVMTPKKMEYAAGARTYAIELVADFYDAHYGQRDGDRRTSNAMESGTQFEPESRRCYEFARDVKVEPVGFMLGGDEDRLGASPDGLVGSDGVLECKNPTPSKHLAWLIGGVVPEEHKAQVHGQLIVSGRAWCDFISYCPGLPPLIVRTEPDEYTDTLRDHLAQFWADYQTVKAEVLGLAGEPICVMNARSTTPFRSMWPTAEEITAENATSEPVPVPDSTEGRLELAARAYESRGGILPELLNSEGVLWEDLVNDQARAEGFIAMLEGGAS